MNPTTHQHPAPGNNRIQQPTRENPLTVAIAIFGGGMLGGALRFTLDLIAATTGLNTMPVGTFAANISGSFLIGLFVALVAHRPNIPLAVHSGITVGLLGGYTTFSTFSLQVLLLLENGQIFTAFGYASTTIGLALLAVWLGEHWGRRTKT